MASGSFESSCIRSWMRRSICNKELRSLLDMDILVALRPQNMSIRERAVSSTGQDIITYIFNGREYTHVGTWPPKHTAAGFNVPIASAYVVDTGQDVTNQVRRFAGPKHQLTDEKVRCALGTWSWRPQCTWSSTKFSMFMKPFLHIPESCSPVCVTNVLGHVSVFCAK